MEITNRNGISNYGGMAPLGSLYDPAFAADTR